MKRFPLLISSAAVVLTLGTNAVFATGSGDEAHDNVQGAPLVGTELGTTGKEIRSSLISMGYEVRKIELEDGDLEAYALKDGARYEIYVDAITGKIKRMSLDD